MDNQLLYSLPKTEKMLGMKRKAIMKRINIIKGDNFDENKINAIDTNKGGTYQKLCVRGEEIKRWLALV